MKRIAVAAILLASILVGAGCTPPRYVQRERERSSRVDTSALMTRHDIVALTRAGIGDSVIISMLNVSGSYFRLSTRDVIALADSGVSDKVIDAMVRTSESPHFAEGDGADYDYPRYYSYYPYWDPWHYPSFYAGFGFRFYRPLYVHRVIRPHNGFSGNHGSFGGHGGGHGFGGGRSGGGGRHR